MDTFQKKFIEEAYEHIEDIEQALLEMDSDMQSKSLVERIFRAMHSLKGGGSMFGFEKVSDFTHHLETVYDLVRNNEMEVNRQLLDLTLLAVDHLKLLLNEENQDSRQLLSDQQSLLAKIEELSTGSANGNKVTNADVVNNASTDEGVKTYFIHFEPNARIFDNGTNPLYLMDELSMLGEIFSIPHISKTPTLDIIEPDKCYTYWEVFLATKEDIHSISDVFIFVEDDCKIEIEKLADHNLFLHDTFTQIIQDIKSSLKNADLTKLKKIIGNLTQQANAQNELFDSVAEEDKPMRQKEHAISSIRVASDKLDQLMNLVSELVTVQARLSLYSEGDGSPELMMISENVQKLSRQLRDIAFSVVLIPIENMITRFQRLIRDLSNELQKDVTFVTEGTETELDKTIIESLTDPLMHILRNSIDHGIENAADREKAGKPVKGTIKLKAFYSGANVHIQISDDGQGIDLDKIREKAIQKGLIASDTPLTKKEILDLVFLPGFSTAVNVTDVSGRGVGMDVVRRKIAEIRGEVELDSDKDVGTTITIKLPLTLSIIDGLLVKVLDTHYIIPLMVVDKIYAARHDDLINAFNNLIILDGEQVPFHYLRQEFNFPENEVSMEQVVVVRYEDQRIGLAVDNVVGEYQAVLKPLGKHYKKQDMISGATILGDGTVALVLDTNKAIKQFSNNNLITEDLNHD